MAAVFCGCICRHFHNNAHSNCLFTTPINCRIVRCFIEDSSCYTNSEESSDVLRPWFENEACQLSLLVDVIVSHPVSLSRQPVCKSARLWYSKPFVHRNLFRARECCEYLTKCANSSHNSLAIADHKQECSGCLYSSNAITVSAVNGNAVNVLCNAHKI